MAPEGSSPSRDGDGHTRDTETWGGSVRSQERGGVVGFPREGTGGSYSTHTSPRIPSEVNQVEPDKNV